jgi:hemoglobin
MQTASLYERVGGEAGVIRLIDIFYQRVLADPELSPFFAHIPMEKLRRMQVEFFTSALGGPLQYSGRPLAHVHQGHGITKTHLRRFTEHLLVTLETLKLSKQDIQSIYTRIALEADEIADDSAGLGSGCEAG